MKIEVNDFNLKDTIESGQCFRVTMENDGSYTTILSDRVLNIKQEGNNIIIHSTNMDNIVNVVNDYFDLKRDYNIINRKLEIDSVMKKCIKKCKGYKIMNQNPFEMCISYIISQNNNVKRISNSIEKLCQYKGKKLKYKNKEYYLFPTYEELKNISIDKLREFGVGFRDKYIKNFLDSYENMNDINSLNTTEALKELMKIKGIGLKVASCILLFGYRRMDVFPIDTWVMKFISNNYDIKCEQKTIEKFAKSKYGSYTGVAIQYMFHSERNVKK